MEIHPMIKALLPLAAALALAPAMPALAQAVCYNDGYSVVNLGSMCGEWRDTTAPAQQPQAAGVRRGSSSNPFPAWLFTNAGQEANETGTAHSENYSRWLISDRFVMTMREWPYTANASNELEFSYVDCQTLWVAGEYTRLAGEVGDWATSPEQAFNPASHRETYGGLCSRLGL